MNDAELRQFARQVLTARQFRIWDDAENGNISHRTIATALGITKGTVTETVREARLKLFRAQEERSHEGSPPATAA